MADLYRKRPVTVEVMRFAGTDRQRHAVKDWIGEGGTTSRLFALTDGPWELHIDTLEGVMRADEGDFIIRGVKGEFYPCKPDIFAATYEPVKEARRG